MNEQNTDPIPKKTLKLKIGAGGAAILAIAYAAFKDSLQKQLSPLFSQLTNWIIKIGGPNIRPFFRFFVDPVTLPSGLIFGSWKRGSPRNYEARWWFVH
jgi:hypothetical protein